MTKNKYKTIIDTLPVYARLHIHQGNIMSKDANYEEMLNGCKTNTKQYETRNTRNNQRQGELLCQLRQDDAQNKPLQPKPEGLAPDACGKSGCEGCRTI